MKKLLLDKAARFTSRKFLLTVATAYLLYSAGEYGLMVGVIGTYIGVEGVGDAAERYSTPKVKAAEAELTATRLQVLGPDQLPDAVDTSEFVAGNPNMSGQ